MHNSAKPKWISSLIIDSGPSPGVRKLWELVTLGKLNHQDRRIGSRNYGSPLVITTTEPMGGPTTVTIGETMSKTAVGIDVTTLGVIFAVEARLRH